MLFSTIGQWKVFFLMTACGMLVGIWYAFLSVARRLLRAGPVISIAVDLLFGAGAFAPIAWGLYAASWGEIRLFSMLAVLFGFLLFQTGANVLARAILRPIVRGIRQSSRKIAQSRLFKVIFR